MNARCFGSQYSGTNNELFKVSRQHVHRGVFLNGPNCHWQSICSGELVHRASNLTGEIVFEAASGGRVFVTRHFLQGLLCYITTL